MNQSLAKSLLIGGILLALLIFGKSYFYAPNDEVGDDSGLQVASTSTTITSSSAGNADLPSHLIIPKLDIDADVQRLGITNSGNMAAPDNFTDVSWYKFGTIPGELGSAVMAGHEDNAVSLDGVFKHLEDLEVGDDVYVVDAQGKRTHFRVTDEQIYPYDNAPVEKIFNTKDKARLNLITCAGDWVPSAKTNDKRLVIYTELVK